MRRTCPCGGGAALPTSPTPGYSTGAQPDRRPRLRPRSAAGRAGASRCPGLGSGPFRGSAGAVPGARGGDGAPGRVRPGCPARAGGGTCWSPTGTSGSAAIRRCCHQGRAAARRRGEPCCGDRPGARAGLAGDGPGAHCGRVRPTDEVGAGRRGDAPATGDAARFDGRRGTAGCPGVRRVAALRSRRGGHPRGTNSCRERDLGAAAFAVVGQGDAATLGSHQAARDRKAQPRPAVFGRCAGAATAVADVEQKQIRLAR